MTSDPTDDDLLRATATGDRQAFEVYYRRNAPWLEIRLRRRCGDAEVAAGTRCECSFTNNPWGGHQTGEPCHGLVPRRSLWGPFRPV